MAIKRLALYICNNAWAGSISLTIEMFNTAMAFQKRLAQAPSFSLTLIGTDLQDIETFSGITIKPERSIKELEETFDAILLPTIWNVNDAMLDNQSALYPWLNKQHQNGASIFASLTGAYLIAETGLLDGMTATTHWHNAQDFRIRYPKVVLQAEKMQTYGNKIYCGGSVNAVMDLSTNLIQEFCGPLIAQQCERHCLMGSRRNYQRLNIDMIERKQHEDARILSVQSWLENHYAEPISLPEIIARFGFSQRNLNRRFKAATGKSPQQYLQEYRLEIAKELLRHNELSIQQICFNVGYESLTVFGRRFKAYTTFSPSQFREQSKKQSPLV